MLHTRGGLCKISAACKIETTEKEATATAILTDYYCMRRLAECTANLECSNFFCDKRNPRTPTKFLFLCEFCTFLLSFCHLGKKKKHQNV